MNCTVFSGDVIQVHQPKVRRRLPQRLPRAVRGQRCAFTRIIPGTDSAGSAQVRGRLPQSLALIVRR
jgi:hypothetical protein